jgi:AraC family transcriptional regulator of adaptative response / DNA-3-methyladenine glycosylase II
VPVTLDDDRCYGVLKSRDPRFDGRFFVAVVTTGIYCRPICPARTPLRRNVRFFECAASAEAAGFRPCRRCRPEAAPGSPGWQGVSATVSRALRLIEQGALDHGDSAALAAQLGVGDRYLRRLFARHLGTSPRAVAMSRRAHFARALLDASSLPMTEVALASGFGSVRRFNQVMRAVFGRTPSESRCARARAWCGCGWPFALRWRGRRCSASWPRAPSRRSRRSRVTRIAALSSGRPDPDRSR